MVDQYGPSFDPCFNEVLSGILDLRPQSTDRRLTYGLTLQVLMHTLCYIFSLCRFRFSASRSRLDHFPISNSAEPVVSPLSPRTIVTNFFSVF
ncbi:hypothetical protein MTR67_019252 [Solanum verrucosum]|uniref:Uncharacterized protein n=1 Tax=Solanum verrucosum TaxID=315347 RepID=A0AAF0TMA6_SOLVR|nr:hypothetical protein MTR67_019250 [Solanum verrucosum]WMV25867.1 hypothetical protein MTR67_019252 [Solanum verrucosum]